MLTALIQARTDPEALAVTLASLVPAVADGLMSHAVVVLAVADDGCARIADAMGATVLVASERPWSAAAAIARGDWVILLEAGEVPDHGWIGVVERHLIRHAGQSGRPALLPAAGTLAALVERVSALLGRSALRSGLVAPRLDVARGSVEAPIVLAVGRQRLSG